jgi:UDP-2,3-diacylglucosamine pyrophosphatase LpxH
MHLGCKHAQASMLARFLEQHDPDHLFLVGDFIDGWKLQHTWRWLPEYTRIMHRLLELNHGGTKLYYTPGNHDDFLRQFLYHFGLVDVREEFVFTTADRRRLLITHGDQFDRFEKSARWFTKTLSFVYDAILSANHLVSKLQTDGRRKRFAVSAAIKLRCKKLAMFLSDYRRQLIKHARQRRCEGIVCGHIHNPEISHDDGITYYNTGDWVEHCTALVEYDTGELELLYFAEGAEGGPLEVVDRILAPQRPRNTDDAWHGEFEDGFNRRPPHFDWDELPFDLPGMALPAGLAAAGITAGPRNRIRRMAAKVKSWPRTFVNAVRNRRAETTIH